MNFQRLIRLRPGVGRSRGNEGEIPTGLESRWSDLNKCIETILAATRQERVQPFVLSDATGPGENTHSSELSEGDVLASEEELARTYQASRTTARQALHGLKTSGYAYSQKGRGTFVTRPKPEKNIMHLTGFTEDMKQRGMVPSSRALEQLAIKATLCQNENRFI